MPLTTVLLRPTDPSFAGSQANYATYVKAAANNYDMRRPVTMSIATDMVTLENHGYRYQQPVVFTTTGALPTGLTAGVTYYVNDAGADIFNVAATPGGAPINLTGTQSGQHYVPWPAWRTNEHNSIMAFAPRSAATKVFAPRSGGNPVLSGNWNDAANWSPNGVPGANAKVLIPEGVTCIYDISSNSPDIYWIRIDGKLEIDITANRHLLVDTILTSPSGTYQCGTLANPVPANVDINVEFSASRGFINVTEDTFKQSRGYVFMGEASCGGYTSVVGAKKTHATRVSNYDQPRAGATSVPVDDVTGWKIGDRIYFAGNRRKSRMFLGTNKGEWRWEGETVTITAIFGNTVLFTPALVRDHHAPLSYWADNQPRMWVRNLTRNAAFSTKDWATVPTEQRAHGMLMHTGDYIFAWASHREMGRTAKHYTNSPYWQGNSTGNQAATAGVPISTNATSPYVSGGTVTYPAEGWIDLSDINSRNGSAYPYTITVVGTDGAGNAISETVVMTGYNQRTASAAVADTLEASGTVTEGRTSKRFKTVTSITYNKDAWVRPTHVTRSFRMTGSGVRVPRGGQLDENSASWVYFPVDGGTNIQGRYPFHVHRSGISDEIIKKNPTVWGIVVEGSPSWGVAHHDAFATFIDSIAIKVSGGGFVGERASEAGSWIRCHVSDVMGGQDSTHKSGPETAWGDPAFNSEAFWWTGRSIKSDGLVADSAMCAFLFNVRFAEAQRTLTAGQLDEPEVLRNETDAGADKSRIELFKNHECFAVDQGTHVLKANALQGHDHRTLLDGLLAWSVREGQHASYTAHYTYTNHTVIAGFDEADDHGNFMAFSTGANTTDQVWIRPRVQGPGAVAFPGSIGFNQDRNTTSGTGTDDTVNNRRIVVAADVRDVGIPTLNGSAFDLNLSSLATLDPPVQPNYSQAFPFVLPNGNGFAPLRTRTTVVDRLGTHGYPRGHFFKGDVLGDMPNGFNVYSGQNEMMARNGIYQNSGDGNDYLFWDEIYADPVTAESFRVRIRYQCGNYPVYRRGTCDLSQSVAPVCQDVTLNVVKGQNLDINLLQYATHPAGRPMVFAGMTVPEGGQITRGYLPSSPGTGVVTFVPRLDFVGTTSFKYWIADVDGNLNSARGATITLNVAEGAVTFQAQPDSASTPYETPVSFNVLANDTGSGLTVTAFTQGASGTISIAANGAATFTPAAGFSGTVSGTYTVRDVNLETRVSTWSVSVAANGAGVSDTTPPSISPVTLRLKSGRIYNLDLFKLMGVTDDYGPLTLAQVTWFNGPAALYNSLSPSGSCQLAVQTGTTQFTVTARDAANNVASATLTIIAQEKGRFFRKL